MSTYNFSFHGENLSALPSGILWWKKHRLLCVSDLHLGKSDRIARLGGTLLPPYETRDTLARLAGAVQALEAVIVICLGDSFDDMAAGAALNREDHTRLASIMAGRQWVWIEGNHDPGPLDIGGAHLRQYGLGPLTFRHVAIPVARAEISGHYHPKASVPIKGRSVSRPCFLLDHRRVILPAFGAYTGGLKTTDPALGALMGDQALAVLTGEKSLPLPMPRKLRSLQGS